MKIVELPLETAQNLLNYLGSKPYSEVFQGIPALQEAINGAKEKGKELQAQDEQGNAIP